MKPAVVRLVLALALFIGWMGYLTFQVVDRPRTATGSPLVLSRPQILASKIDVIAEVPDKSGAATIKEVLYPDNSSLKPGDKIQVTNIGECRPPLSRDDGQSSSDFTGPGLYLLPLRPLSDSNKYEVQPIPQSPGFSTGLNDPPPRIYPAKPEALAQYRHIAKAE
jgi:hypothetical protein